MDCYEALALELMHTLDLRRKGPPGGEISAAMRGEMAVLRLLEQEGKAMTAGEISRALQMTTSRIAAVLGSLEKKEMILRACDEADKRRVLVSLTKAGGEFCRARRQEAFAHMRGMLEHLGQEDAAHYVRIMKRIQTFLPEHEKPGQEQKKKEVFADE